MYYVHFGFFPISCYKPHVSTRCWEVLLELRHTTAIIISNEIITKEDSVIFHRSFNLHILYNSQAPVGISG